MQTHFLTFAKGNAIRTVMFGAADFDAATRDVQAAREAHGITPISITARHEHYGVRDMIRRLAWFGLLALLVLPLYLAQDRDPNAHWPTGTVVLLAVWLAFISFVAWRSRAKDLEIERRSLDGALRAASQKPRWLLHAIGAICIIFAYANVFGPFVASTVDLLKGANSNELRGIALLIVATVGVCKLTTLPRGRVE